MAKAEKTSVAALARSPSHLLHRALQLALDVYGEEAGAVGLTQRQYAVLAAVAAHEGLTQTDLVRATGIDRSTLADMIARMTEKGYLGRERSTLDARAKTVRLTDKGRVSLQEAAPLVAGADARILGHLTAGKRDAFIAALSALSKAGEASLVGDDAPKKKKKDKVPKAEKTAKAPKPDKKKKKKAKKDKVAVVGAV
jgi:MarR family transcriptional regulator, temperature-dependent positive regulator of motility